MPRKSLVLPILFILFSAGILPYSYASPESEAQEDIDAGCRDGQTLVYRSTYQDFVCVEPSTADRWEELGLAEIVKESDEKSETNISESAETLEFPGAPPPAPKPTVRDSSDDSMCRDGNILVYHFAYKDTICTSFSTATTWERIGLVEIVKTQTSTDESFVEINVDLSSEDIVETVDSSIEEVETMMDEEVETMMDEEVETMMDEEVETMMDDGVEFVEVFPQFSNESGEYPIIREVEEHIWNSIDYDGSTSFFIEGDKGIIVINSLNSYQSNKKIIDQYQQISDKKINAIILTKINPEILFALEAYLEKSDGNVNIIISEDLLQQYERIFDAKVKNTIPFSSSLSVDIVGIHLELFTNDQNDSFQTLIFNPDNRGLIIADSKYGTFPYLFSIERLSTFLTEELEVDSENDL